jgi:hypothetical protein
MEGRGPLDKKSKILLVLVVMVVIAALIVGSTMLGSSPAGSDEGTDEPLDQEPISTSTADMILPLSSLTSEWIIGSDPGSVSTTPSAVEQSSACYETRDAYYTQVLSVYVMKFNSIENASDAYLDQYHQKEDKYSVSTIKIGNGGFEYDLLDRVFYITFHKANILVVMKVTNSNMEALETYADLQMQLIK